MSLLMAVGYVDSIFFLLHPRDAYTLHRGIVPMLAGTAERPFVNRTLLPSAVRLLGGPIDPAAVPQSETPRRRDGVRGLIERTWEVRPANRESVVLAFKTMVFCFTVFGLGILGAVRRSIDVAFDRALLYAIMVGALPALWSLEEPNQIYDSATLACASILTLLAMTRRRTAFLIALVPALFAKESLALLALLLIVPLAMDGRRREAAWVALIALVECFAVALVLRMTYGRNPGVGIELSYRNDGYHWQENLRVLAFVSQHSANVYWKLLIVLVPLGFSLRRSSKDTRRVVAITSLALLGPLFFVGRFAEPRIWYELLPLWTLIAAPPVFCLLGVRTPPVELASGAAGRST